MSMVLLPPELRSLCRKLSTAPEQLPNILPGLLRDVQRCKRPLSAPQDSKTNANSPEATVLVHQLRKQIDALLGGKTPQGRFVATALVKAIVETGGWECLRASGPWVVKLLAILQRREPAVTKELCLVTLTKIFTLLQGYQTLIREIATPHLQPFAQACLQILKPPASSKAPKPSLDFVESIFEAISTLLPLYPTTLRPSAVQFRSAAKPFLAPTTSDGIFVPRSLQQSSQRLVIRLHMTAAKGGGVEEWAKHTNGLIKSFHETADQVLRAVHENWESTTGYTPQHVDLNGAPHGGGDSADQLPPWTGVEAGSERMIGLLRFLGNCLQCGTKTPVTIPISRIFDIAMRIASIIPPNQGRDKSGATQTNAAIGREEKEELWAVFPEIQIATLELLLTVMRRLERSYTPMAPETLDLALRIFESGYRIPELRVSVFTIVRELLVLSGPTMAKTNVEALSLVTKACCRDLLGNAGHVKVPKPQASLLQNGAKAKTLTQNADSFLVGSKDEETLQVTLAPEHVAAAEELLVALFNRLPQQFINSSLRAQMLKVAILCQIKDAQVASVLHPSRDRSGRMPQAILPYLHRQFPHDETIEILRFNYRPMTASVRADAVDAYDDMEADDVSMEEPADGFAFDKPFEASAAPKPQEEDVLMAEQDVTAAATEPMPAPAPIQASPFLAQPTAAVEAAAEEPAAVKPATRANTRKRKSDEAAEAAAKRVEREGAAKKPEGDDADPGFAPVGMLVESSLQPKAGAADEAGEGDSDDESVHLNMELDSDDDDDDDDQGE